MKLWLKGHHLQILHFVNATTGDRREHMAKKVVELILFDWNGACVFLMFQIFV